MELAWMDPGGGMGGCIPPTGLKIYAFYMVDFLRRLSFRTREYYVPLTMTRHTPPPPEIFWSRPWELDSPC